jgi:hypothetical protein
MLSNERRTLRAYHGKQESQSVVRVPYPRGKFEFVRVGQKIGFVLRRGTRAVLMGLLQRRAGHAMESGWADNDPPE